MGERERFASITMEVCGEVLRMRVALARVDWPWRRGVDVGKDEGRMAVVIIREWWCWYSWCWNLDGDLTGK